MKWNNDHLVFETSGRKFFADKFVGITKYEGATLDKDVIEITQGTSGTIDVVDENYEVQCMTDQEKVELADYMISLWQQFKAPVNS